MTYHNPFLSFETHINRHFQDAFLPSPVKLLVFLILKIMCVCVCVCVCVYVVAVRRGHQIPLQMVLSHHVVAGN